MTDDSEDIFLQQNGFTYLNYDPWTGITTWFKTNEDGSTTIYNRLDNEALLEQNAAGFMDTKNRKLGELVPLASFDDISMQNLHLSEAIQQSDRKYLRKVLNDPELRKFRTSNLKA